MWSRSAIKRHTSCSPLREEILSRVSIKTRMSDNANPRMRKGISGCVCVGRRFGMYPPLPGKCFKSASGTRHMIPHVGCRKGDRSERRRVDTASAAAHPPDHLTHVAHLQRGEGVVEHRPE